MTDTIIPQIVNIELTNRCNLACIFCDHPTLQKKMVLTDFDTGLLKKLLGSFKPKEIYEIGLVGLGEPLLDKKLYDHLDVIGAYSNLFKRISMNSNGVTLSLKASELILDSCINLITFSLNATNRNSYKKLMKKDLFDIVVKNIRNFLELRKNKRKKINVSIQFMSSRLNKQKEMEELFSEYLDADTLVYNRYVFNKPVINNSKKQLIDINRIETLERHPCWSIYSRVYIDVKGNVYPCTIGNDSYRETSSMNLGNINKNDLIDIFNSEPIKNAREKSEKCDLAFQECMDCTLWELFPNNFKLQYGRWKQNNDIIIRKKNMNRLD